VRSTTQPGSARWVDAGGALLWIDPLIDMREVLPATAKVHADHVLPKNEIAEHTWLQPSSALGAETVAG